MQVITLTSDIGHKDFLKGAIKGCLLKINTSFNICDISHNVDAFDVNQAAYLLKSAYKYFPENTWHLVFVNLFDYAGCHLILAKYNNQFFACPDNYLLPLVFENEPMEMVRIKVPADANITEWARIMGNAINYFNNGVPFEKLGDSITEIRQKNALKPSVSEQHIDGSVLYVDNYDNVITNISKDDFENARKGRDFVIVFKGNETIERLSDNYASVPQNNKLAYFNTAGYLEIAINKGSASKLFGLKSNYNLVNDGSLSEGMLSARMFYSKIRIDFKNATE